MKRNICNTPAIGLLLCVAIEIFFPACYSRAKNDIESAEKFKVVNPALLDTVYTNEYVAEIQSVQNVEIRSRVKGFIEKILVDEGDAVQAGQVLFMLSSRAFREDLIKANAQLKSAMAELKAIEVELKNTRLLSDENIISKTELESSQAKKEAIEARIDEARSAISLAQLNLSFSQVKAPFNGVINRIPNKTGSLVEDGTLFTTISNNKEVFAYFNVSEKEYLNFIKQKEVGKLQQVSLIMADGTLFPNRGTIETAETEINKSTGNLAFRARFSNEQQLLKHGASAKVLMNIDLKNVLVVPQKSTFEVQDKINVYVIDANNMVQIKSFVPRFRLPHLYVVETGLTPDDKIIYEGVQLVKEGEKIIPELIPFYQVAAQLAQQ